VEGGREREREIEFEFELSEVGVMKSVS